MNQYQWWDVTIIKHKTEGAENANSITSSSLFSSIQSPWVHRYVEYYTNNESYTILGTYWFI